MTVIFHGNVQEYTSGKKSYTAGATQSMRTLIETLCEHFGENFREFLLGKDTCFFLVNGKGIIATGGLDTPLHPEDKVDVLPFVGGG